MPTMTMIQRSRYYDSVKLMSVAKALTEMDGVVDAAAVMGTPANLDFLSSAGLLTPEAGTARPDDLVVAVSAGTDDAASAALARATVLLDEEGAPGGLRLRAHARSLASAIRANPDANLVVISVAGRFAAREARTALEHGLSVLLFSDNVPLEQEIALKQLAAEKGLLCMGPDAGTAIIDNVALGFANAIPRGPVGLIGASGTGLQGVACGLARLRVGVTQAIGVGGRDLSQPVGGKMMLASLNALDSDPDTKVIVLISKPPAPVVAARVLDRVRASPKPAVVCFLGTDPQLIEAAGAYAASDLAEAAALAATLAEGGDPATTLAALQARGSEWTHTIEAECAQLAAGQWAARGLFSGGTFCYEAQLLLQDLGNLVHSNAPLGGGLRLPDAHFSIGHTMLDLGEDEFTQGRLHPMIDPSQRNRRIVQEAGDPATAVILLDVVLGYGAHPDPAGAAAEAILEARQIAQAAGRHIVFIASVCGTEADPQVLSRQEAALRDAGVIVTPDNASAARLTRRIAELCSGR